MTKVPKPQPESVYRELAGAGHNPRRPVLGSAR